MSSRIPLNKVTAKVRKEDLIKWQKKRKAQKVEEDAKKRPPFVVGRYVETSKPRSKRRVFNTHTSTTSRNMKSKMQKKDSKLVEEVKQPLKDGHSTLNIQPSPPHSQGTMKKHGAVLKGKDGDENRRSSSPSLPAQRSTTEDEGMTCARVPGGVTLPTPQNPVENKPLTPKPSSPFRFTASNKDEEIDGPNCTGGEDMFVGRSDNSIDDINHSIYHNHEMANTINDNYHQVDSTNSPAVLPEVNKEDDGEFAPFRKMHDDVVKKFTTLCQEWEEKEAVLKHEGIAADNTVEVCDQIRTTVCQARLLMRSKLNQFIGLVEKAEDPNQPLPTTVEDLRGFWDMVYFQVTDVEGKFSSLQSLEDNNWQEQKPEKKVAVTRKKRRRSSAGKRKKTPSDKMKAARARIAEQRKELKKKISAKRKGNVSPSSPAVLVTVKDGRSPVIGHTPALESTTTPLVKKRGSFIHPGELSSTPLPKRRCLQRSAKRKSINCTPEHGHVTKLIRVTPSKSVIERFGSDMIVSPARRSVRIQRKSVGMASGPLDDEVPLGCNFVYKPNKLINDFNEY